MKGIPMKASKTHAAVALFSLFICAAGAQSVDVYTSSELVGALGAGASYDSINLQADIVLDANLGTLGASQTLSGAHSPVPYAVTGGAHAGLSMQAGQTLRLSDITFTGFDYTAGDYTVEGGVVAGYGTLILSNASFLSNALGADGDEGSAGFGAAIASHGTVSATNSTFAGNIASPSADIASQGGAICMLGGDSLLTLNNATFRSNTAKLGAAIYAEGTIAITGDTTFSGNQQANAQGGAIYSIGGDIRIAEDVALVFDGQIAGGSAGGAIYVKSLEKDTVWDFSNTTVSNNLSGNGTVAVYIPADSTGIPPEAQPEFFARRVYIPQDSTDIPTLTIRGGVFENNTAGDGAAVYADSALSLTGTVIAGNTGQKNTLSAGGLTLDGVSITGNMTYTQLPTGRAETAGSALASDGDFSSTNSTISGNVARMGEIDDKVRAEESFGTMAFYGMLDEGRNISLANTTVSGNEAAYGGAMSFVGNGGSFTATFDSATVISGNTAYYGGAIHNFAADTTLDADGAVISSNSAIETLDGDAGHGGAVFVETGSLAVSNATLSDNSASFGGAAANRSVASFTDVDFINNTATTHGGAIYNRALTSPSGTSLTIEAKTRDVLFSGNAAQQGADLYNMLGTVELKTASGKKITFEGSVFNYDDNHPIALSGAGRVVFMDSVAGKIQLVSGEMQIASAAGFSAADLDLSGGRALLGSGSAANFQVKTLAINGDSTIALDVLAQDNYSTLSVLDGSLSGTSGTDTITVTFNLMVADGVSFQDDTLSFKVMLWHDDAPAYDQYDFTASGIAGYAFSGFDIDGTGLTLNFSLVPEPAACAALLGAFVLLMAARRRRK